MKDLLSSKASNIGVGSLLVALCFSALLPGFTKVRSDDGPAQFILAASTDIGEADGPSRGFAGVKLSGALESARAELPEQTVSAILQVRDVTSKSLRGLLKSNGIRVNSKLGRVNALEVELPVSAIQPLIENDEVSYISGNDEVTALGHLSLTTGADAVRSQVNSAGKSYALEGTGVGIAVLDSGIDVTHKAFKDDKGVVRVVASVDFTGEARTDDPFGHGTHVAALAAANGAPTHEKYVGIAANANLINLRVLNSRGVGSVSSVLNAINWVMNNRTVYNIRVVNLSIGTPAVASYQNDPICRAVRGLVDAGIVVAAAAGNDGKDDAGQMIYGRIHSPGIEPSAITVGCSNTMGTDSRADDAIATYSSRGPTRAYWTDSSGVNHYDNLVKPDLVAPGNREMQAEALSNYLVTSYPNLESAAYPTNNMKLMYLSGTSMSTPQVAGAAALLLQANPSLTPNLVKAILMYTAQPLIGYNTFEQGTGELDIEGAVRLAKLVRTNLTSTTPLGSPLLTVNSAPIPQTTIAGVTFNWAQGIIGNYSFATGVDLITKYQVIFGTGHLLSNGFLLSNGHLLSNTLLMTGGVSVANTIVTSNGYALGSGTLLMSVDSLLGDGTLLPEGHLLSNGVVLGDGHLLSNNTLQSLSVLVNGDETPFMR